MSPDVRALAAALALDAVCGEPPAVVHPVVWMGRVLDRLEERAPHGDNARLVYGLVVAFGVPLAWGGLAHLAGSRSPWPVQALALKPALAGRALLTASHQVEADLLAGDLVRARDHLRALVSRSTDELEDGLMAAAAIESLAENLVDSWVAPLLAYAACGLGGAYAYRAANTADAMWGYRSPRYEFLGKGAARLDDVLNWLPARLGAGCLLLAASRRALALKAWRRDSGRTASPNAGQPMADQPERLRRRRGRGRARGWDPAQPGRAGHLGPGRPATRGTAARDAGRGRVPHPARRRLRAHLR